MRFVVLAIHEMCKASGPNIITQGAKFGLRSRVFYNYVFEVSDTASEVLLPLS